jgi:alkylation response protein AidB-like acyl-CoA dehydrogenase
MSAAPPILAYQSLTDEQAELGRGAQALLTARRDDERAGADVGWFGIGIPEEMGGSGGTLGDLAVVLEAAGWATAATAVSLTAGLTAPLLAAADPPVRDVLAPLSAGQLAVAVPTADPAHVGADADRGQLSGTVQAIGGDVDALAVAFGHDGRSGVALVPADHASVRRSPLVALDPSRPLSAWQLDGVALASVTIAFVDGLVERWRAHLSLVSALDAMGAARAALARTIAYARDREQFGQPIGSFQAYKHRAATALVELKLGQALAFRAADDLAHGDTTTALAAGLTATRSALDVCGTAVQLHGAIGFTWEAGLHRYLKRARTAQLLADRPATARQLLARTAAPPATRRPA